VVIVCLDMAQVLTFALLERRAVFPSGSTSTVRTRCSD
jgi:hypothetical protein